MAGGAVTIGGATGAENALRADDGATTRGCGVRCTGAYGAAGAMGAGDADRMTIGANGAGFRALTGAPSEPVDSAGRSNEAPRGVWGGSRPPTVTAPPVAAPAIARGANGSAPPPATADPGTDARGVSSVGCGVDKGAGAAVLGGSVLLMRGGS